MGHSLSLLGSSWLEALVLQLFPANNRAGFLCPTRSDLSAAFQSVACATKYMILKSCTKDTRQMSRGLELLVLSEASSCKNLEVLLDDPTLFSRQGRFCVVYFFGEKAHAMEFVKTLLPLVPQTGRKMQYAHSLEGWVR